MEYTFDYNLFSDFFKETYGFRPRNNRFYDVETTDDERQVMWDNLLDYHKVEMDYQEKVQQEAIAEFEALIITTIGYGAGDRKTAIRWILDGLDDSHDAGYMCYHFNIPYSYENEMLSSMSI